MTLIPLQNAVLATVVYSDLFDQPLTPVELHRYLHGCRIERDRLETALSDGLLDALPIAMVEGHLTLEGAVEKVQLRAERRRISDGLFPAAGRYGRIAARLPFIRMLALTGGLAVGNAAEDDDIDYLVISEPGRIWTSRLFFLFLVKLAGLRGITLCPNYFLDADSLALTDHSIFTARELAQMVPLAGFEMYTRMRAANMWADDCLPNASGPPRETIPPAPDRRRGGLVEQALAGRAGAGLERWEMTRKVRKLSATRPPTDETAFDDRRVQGHFEGYRARTLAEFDRRMKAYT